MDSHRQTGWRIAPAVLAALGGATASLGASPFPGVIELASLDGTDGFVINGINIGEYSGYSVSSAGDVNGDGVDDLIIGAPEAAPNGLTYAGESYVVFGGPSVGASGSIDLGALNGTNGFVVHGVDAGGDSGFSVSSADDVNGDGYDDVIIGAPEAYANGQAVAGKSYVVFGGPGVGAGGSIDLGALNGVTGFVINGIDIFGVSGISVSSAGDVNGDGYDDVIIGAPQADVNGQWQYATGKSYVVFGGPGVGAGGSIDLGALNGANGFVLNGIDRYDASGNSVSSAGDVNGDGYDDVIIGAASAGGIGDSGAPGESYIVFSGSGVGVGGSIDLGALNGANGFVVYGIRPGDHSGSSVSGAGDFNGDGVNDLIIGAPDPDESYIVFGRASVGAGGSIDLGALNGTNGFVLRGSYGTGWSVSAAGDVNADGDADVIIGAPWGTPNEEIFAGESYVVFGGAGVGASGAINLSSLNGSNGFVINGIRAESGWSVASAGDVNGDGIDDVIVGAQLADQAYVVFGRAPITCDGDVDGDGETNIADFNILAGHFGQSVTPGTSGDLTGNGIVNVADFNILAGNFGCGV